MLVGDRVHARPVAGETEEARLTDPVNPLCAATVIVEVPLTPARTVMLVGFAVTLYDVAEWTVTVVLVVKRLSAPLTVTVKVPGEEEFQDSYEAPAAAALL